MGKLKKYVPFRITEEDYVWLVDRASVLNVDVSELIRRIIHMFRFLTEQPLIFLMRSYTDLEKEFGEEGVLLLSPQAQEAVSKLVKERKEKGRPRTDEEES